MNKAGSKIARKSTFLFLIFAASFALAGWRATYSYTNGFDEHSHLSYVQYAHEFKIPANGYSMNTWAKEAFSCHPHSIFGPMTQVKCGDILQGYGYPTGGSNTSQAWPPVYFIIDSLLMRPFEIFTPDHLYSARFGSALLWSFGITAIANCLLSIRIAKSNIAISTLLMTALPVSAYYSSFVTPYSATPMLVAIMLWIFRKQIGPLPSQVEPLNLKTWVFFGAASILAMFTIPHFILGIFCFGIAAALASSRASARLQSSRNLSGLVIPFLVASAITMLSKLTFGIWPFIQSRREVPYPADVRVEMGNVDPPDISYGSVEQLIRDRLLTFWPHGINFGYPSSGWLYILVSIWVITLGGFSVLMLLRVLGNSRFSTLGTALVIASSTMSIAYAVQLPTPPPIRYGFTAVVIGCLLLSDDRVLRPKHFGLRVVGALVIATYILSFTIAPIYNEAGTCKLETDRLIHCVK